MGPNPPPVRACRCFSPPGYLGIITNVEFRQEFPEKCTKPHILAGNDLGLRALVWTIPRSGRTSLTVIEVQNRSSDLSPCLICLNHPFATGCWRSSHPTTSAAF